MNTSTSEKCFYIGLKCRSQSGCPKEEYRVRIESSIILRSCIIRIASTLFCLSFQNKHFLKHSIASEFEKILLSWPSSAWSPLLSSWKEDCTTTLSKICSSDSCGELGASFHLATEQLLTNQTSIELSSLVTTRASAAFASWKGNKLALTSLFNALILKNNMPTDLDHC